MQRHLKERPYIFPLLGLAFGFVIVGLIWVRQSTGDTFRPSDANIVFLFDKGKHQVIDTKAETVGELVSRLDLGLIPEDVVEPSLDTPIVEDNLRINIYRARPVTVIDKNNKIVTLTAQRSPRVAAKKAGLDLHTEDIARFEQGNLSENVIGEKVVIVRGIPIKLNLYGQQVGTYTLSKTVEEMLREKQIKLDNGEKVEPALETAIKPNMQIFVLSKGANLVTVKEVIPIPTKTVNDPGLSFGSTAVRQEGSPGKKLVTYLVTKKDGKESRKLIQQAIIDPPEPKIIARGSTINVARDKTKLMSLAGIKSSDYGYVNYIVSRESGWNHLVSGIGGAYGLCQALPGSKMSTAGSDWQTNPVTQLRWCSGYASSRYGGWGGAYNQWIANHYW